MERVIQIPAQDGCVYVYNIDTQTIKKVCDIVDRDDVPDEVLDTLGAINCAIKTDRRKG